MSNKLSLDAAALAIILGILPLLVLPELPCQNVWFAVLLAACILLATKKAAFRFIAVVLFGFVWATFSASGVVSLIERYSEQTINVVGFVKSAAIGLPENNRILFRVERIEQRSLPFYKRFDLVLNWPHETARVAAGQRWRLNVSVRPVHGQLNQGGFNLQRWAIANRRALSGYVKRSELLEQNETVRQSLIDKTNAIIHSLSHKDILLALGFGERGFIAEPRQQLLLQTGIAHLMAISGLHISLAAMLGFVLIRAIQWFLPQRYIGLGFPYLAGWTLAVVYTWLSGANPPAVRAVLALTIWLGLRRYSLFCSAWQVWLYIVAALLIYDPLMVLSDSVWLSCGAVAGLIFWFQWAPLKTVFYNKRWFLMRWFHLQLAMFLLLIPLQVLIFQGISLSSLLSNLIAVPIVSFITVPLILLAMLLSEIPALAQYFWLAADASLALIFPLLERLQAGWLVIGKEFALLSFIGWLAVIVWRLELWRTAYVAVLSLIVLAFNVDKVRPDYLWRVDMLDVGHGLAIIIHNGKHAVLYDTGNRWEKGSVAERTIAPFLNHHGLTLDGIIISHDDSDHAGGLVWLLEKYPYVWLRRSALSAGALPCLQGEQWRWRGLYFEALWPENGVERAGNSDSCVIKVSDGAQSILLTGDLEKQQELALVRRYGSRLKADILQTPHHGSNTSSSGPFLRNVAPSATLTSISRFNPWRLPADKVKQRYNSMGIDWYSTAWAGQISVLFSNDKQQIYHFRQDLSYRWYNQRFGDSQDKD